MGNMIDVDYTILIQLANFLVTIVVLNFLLIKPVRKQIAERREFAKAHTTEIEVFNAEANTKLAAYEASLSSARTAAVAAREQRRAEGHTREQEIVSAAQADAQKFLHTSRETVRIESKNAMDALLGQVNEFASKAATRIFS